MFTLRSKLMDELYGMDESKKVFENLEGLDPLLNKEVQEIAYNHYWAMPGLSIRDKSLITIVSLISLKKEAQTKPHMIGFLNTGGTSTNLVDALILLSSNLDVSSAQKALDTLCEILRERKESQDKIMQLQETFKKGNNDSISKKDAHFVNVASCAAIGNQEKTKASIRSFLDECSLDKNDLKYILIHLIVYCGFPVAVNGFNALKAVIDEKLSLNCTQSSIRAKL